MYKYPYIASEILSHDFPFLLDKLITSNNNNSNFLKIGTNTSCIFGDMSNNDLNFYMDEFDDNFTKKENNIIKEEKDEIFEDFQENGENIEIFENENELELIDYIFNISFSQELNGVQGSYFIKIIRSLMHSLYSPNKSIIFLKYILFGKNGEILNNIIKNIKHYYFQEILYEILKIFAEENINLTKVESRPSKNKLGTYIFFIDLEGHRMDERINNILNEVKSNTSYFKLLGSYPIFVDNVE